MYNEDGEELHDNGMTDEEYIVHLNNKFIEDHLRLCDLERRVGFPEGEYRQCTTADEIEEADEMIQARVRRLEDHYARLDREKEAERKRNWKPYL